MDPDGRNSLLWSHFMLKCHWLWDLSDPHSHTNPLTVLISSFEGGFQELSETVGMLAFSVLSSSCWPAHFCNHQPQIPLFLMGITGFSVLISGYRKLCYLDLSHKSNIYETQTFPSSKKKRVTSVEVCLLNNCLEIPSPPCIIFTTVSNKLL